MTPFHTDHVGRTLDIIPDMLTYMCRVCLPGVNPGLYVVNMCLMPSVTTARLYDFRWINVVFAVMVIIMQIGGIKRELA